MNKSRILLIYTGGTIGMIRDENSGAYRAFNFENLLTQMPVLAQVNCEILTETLGEPIDSSDMRPEIWLALVEIIERYYNEVDGFVILHGSDTMAYTASALSFMLENLDKPVILTGSQLPIGVLRSDARENLITSFEIATLKHADGRAQVPEVAVYFEYNLYRGNRIYKYSGQDFEAFESPNYPVLGDAGVNLILHHKFIHRPEGQQLITHKTLNANVGVVYLFPGLKAAQVRHQLENPNIQAFILLTYGAGNAMADPDFLLALRNAVDSGKILVNVSQCRNGVVDQDKYQLGKNLSEAGVIGAGDMTLEAAITKLMVLLGGLSPDETKKAFVKSIAGEMSNEIFV